MEQAVIRILPLLLVLATAGCYPNRTSFFSSSPKVSKEVLINNERYKRPYAILGPVEYTLRKNTSLFLDQLDLREEAIEFLKQEALARYGQSVDAIVDVQVVENAFQNVKGKLNVTHVKGTAIAFWPQADKSSWKSKARAKYSKPSLRKPKSSVGDIRKEPPTEEIVITPSEILK